MKIVYAWSSQVGDGLYQPYWCDTTNANARPMTHRTFSRLRKCRQYIKRRHLHRQAKGDAWVFDHSPSYWEMQAICLGLRLSKTKLTPNGLGWPVEAGIPGAYWDKYLIAALHPYDRNDWR